MITAVQEERVTKSLEEKLEGLAVEIRYGAPLSEFTTFQIGGPADALALPRGEEELLALIARCREERLPVSLLGGGANTLVLDGGVRGVVISPALGFREVEISKEGPEGALLEAGAGAKIPSVARLAAERGLTGLECVFGVPGTVGGALAMNAGTAERYIGEAVESVRWIPFAGGGAERLPAERLSFAYRRTVFPEEGIVLSDAGLLEKARSSLQNAIELSPDYLDAIYALAVVEQRAGRTEQAETGYLQVLELEYQKLDGL